MLSETVLLHGACRVDPCARQIVYLWHSLCVFVCACACVFVCGGVNLTCIYMLPYVFIFRFEIDHKGLVSHIRGSGNLRY